MEDLRTRSAGVSERETDVIRDQLARNRVTVFDGTARFVDADTVVITATPTAAGRSWTRARS